MTPTFSVIHFPPSEKSISSILVPTHFWIKLYFLMNHACTGPGWGLAGMKLTVFHINFGCCVLDFWLSVGNAPMFHLMLCSASTWSWLSVALSACTLGWAGEKLRGNHTGQLTQQSWPELAEQQVRERVEGFLQVIHYSARLGIDFHAGGV